MSEKKEGVTLSLWVDQATIERLDRISEKLETSRSKLAAQLLEAGLDDAEILAKTDTLQLVTFLRGMKESARKRRQADAELAKKINAQLA